MKNFYDNGLKFECQRCSQCCGHTPGYVYLSKKDLNLLSSFYSIAPELFVEKYCRWTGYYEGRVVLALDAKKNNDCVLWSSGTDNKNADFVAKSKNTGTGGCSAYFARPVQCRTYPFWSWMIKDQSMWEECAKDCPGMNKGQLWTKEVIEALKKESDENEPLDKDEFEKIYNNH